MAQKTHYEALSVRPDSTVEEIRRSYHHLAKKHHPDRFVDGPERRRAEEIFSAMTEAFTVLTNPARRKVYDEQQREAASGETPAQKEARGYFRAGNVKLSQGVGSEAARLFQAAIHLDSTQGSYYAHYARALELCESYGDASRQWDEAIKRDPYNAKYYRLAGQCLEKAGMLIRSRRMYEAALKWDKDDEAAAESLRRLGGEEKKPGLLSGLFKKA